MPQFTAMFVSSPALSRQVVNWYSMYINRFLYETIHQEFNHTRIKLCNLLYLLLMNRDVYKRQCPGRGRCCWSPPGSAGW